MCFHLFASVTFAGAENSPARVPQTSARFSPPSYGTHQSTWLHLVVDQSIRKWSRARCSDTREEREAERTRTRNMQVNRVSFCFSRTIDGCIMTLPRLGFILLSSSRYLHKNEFVVVQGSTHPSVSLRSAANAHGRQSNHRRHSDEKLTRDIIPFTGQSFAR